MEWEEAFKVVYNFMKYYVGHLPKTADDWRLMVDRANEIVKKHDNDAYLCSMIVSSLMQIEREVKKCEDKET